MKIMKIPLTRGQITTISAVDAEIVSAFRWHATPADCAQEHRYYARSSKGTYLHRFLLKARPGELVDHINNDGLDNRRENLRLANHTLNLANRYYKSASGFRGVYQVQKHWDAQISVARRMIRIGSFKCPIDAARAYDKAAIERFGEFATLNFPESLVA